MPSNLPFADPVTLEWDASLEEDFRYHSVYGSEGGVFDESATLIDHMVDPTYDVSGTPFAYYHVTTSDVAGNESAAASAQSETTSVDPSDAQPRAFSLGAARPSPLHASATMSFDLPRAGHAILRVLDVNGRLVRVVTAASWPAGRHTVKWDGRDEQGRAVVSGVYFARLEAGAFRAERRLVVVR